MGNKSTCPLGKLKNVTKSCSEGPSSDLVYASMRASASEIATTSSSTSSRSTRKDESRDDTSVEDLIEQSKVHWSQLAEHPDLDEDEVAEVSNMEVFKTLQRHPTWGHFFRTFGDGGIYDCGELEVGEKFAEGGQAELYHACITWMDPSLTSHDLKHGIRWVLKVFRKGTFLRDLQKQWPEGMFRQYEDLIERPKLGKPQQLRVTCFIECATLFPNGRFAFLLVRETEDLRTFIEREMKARTNLDSGPFSMTMTFAIMYHVALGMVRLHNLNIVHRDLKASNVLCSVLNKNSKEEGYTCFVADFECSIGVVGTGFFRAPEILQAIKDKVVNTRPNVFTKASDVYSYGMVCYEILTGKLPFEGDPTYDFNLVLSGQRPEVPHHVDEWVCDLLQRCWQVEPTSRPSFAEILNIFEENVEICKWLKEDREKREMTPIEVRYILKYDFED